MAVEGAVGGVQQPLADLRGRVGAAGPDHPGVSPLMPRTSALDAQALLALGAERLTELLLELAASDPAIKRQLKLAVATTTSPQDAAAQVRQRLATIGSSRRFLEREKRQLIRKDLTAQLDAITGPIAQGDPAAALALPRPWRRPPSWL